MNANKMAMALQLLGIGWYVATCIGGGAIGGWLLDRRFDISPLFTLLGLALGITVAGFGMVKMLMAVLTTSDDDNGASDTADKPTT